MPMSCQIADRLCASIGQDILDCLFSRSTLEPLSHHVPVTVHTFRPMMYFVLALAYNGASLTLSSLRASHQDNAVLHTLVMVYQMISLNVAVNSYDHALLTLLLSNQFVEIKGSVFKKFEKDNLFQITCADIVERFTLALMLVVVAFRNLIELSGTEFDFSQGFVLPKSFGWFRGNNVLWTISYVCICVVERRVLLTFAIARVDRSCIRDGRRLAQARVHHQVQPYPTVSVRAICGRAMQGFGVRKCYWQTRSQGMLLFAAL